jgi:hypothetical protein
VFKKTETEPTTLDRAIDAVLLQMLELDASTKEYAAMADQLLKLNKLKEENLPRRVSADTLATVIANLVGIAMILNHERAGVVASKAVSFVMKLR